MTRKEARKATADRVKESIDALHRALGQSRADARESRDEDLHEYINADPALFPALNALDRVVAQLAHFHKTS